MNSMLAGFIGVVGAWQALMGYLDLRLARAVASWPVVRGHLGAAELRAAPFGPGRIVVRVHYSYTVGGTRFTGDRFTFRRFYSVSEARRSLYRVSDASTVAVHHDPDRPERAVLLPGAGSRPALTVAFGLAMLVLAAVLGLKAGA